MSTATTDRGGAAVTQQRPGPRELLRTLGTMSLQKEAADKGRSLSAHLETIDPSGDYKDGNGLDAFGRLLKEAGIVTRSDAARGYHADTFDKFLNGTDRADGTATRALAMEWASRVWRKAATGGDPNTRSLLTSDLETLGSVMRPYVDAAAARFKQIAPAIPLSEVVAITTPIDSDAYRAFYFDADVAADQRLVRVTEGADVPKVTLKGGDRTIRLHKYGRALDLPYETLRRQRIDKVAFWLSRLAVQAEADKLEHAVDVLINGDGNTGTAATNHNQSALDTGTTPTVKGHLSFKLKFTNPYICTHYLFREATALSILLLNLGSANIPLVEVQGLLGVGGLTPINPELRDGIRYGITDAVAASVVLGIDSRFALEMVTEIGSTLAESAKFVQRQTEMLVLSEVVGFAVADQFASKTWTTNA